MVYGTVRFPGQPDESCKGDPEVNVRADCKRKEPGDYENLYALPLGRELTVFAPDNPSTVL